MNGDDDYKKKHKVNSKKECRGASCPVPSGYGTRKLPSISHVRNDDGMPSKTVHVVQPVYVEKVGYQAGTVKWNEPTQEKPEESGSGMTKEERDAKMKAYKTKK